MKRAGTRREVAGGLRKEAVIIIRGAEAVIITRMKQVRRLRRLKNQDRVVGTQNTEADLERVKETGLRVH